MQRRRLKTDLPASLRRDGATEARTSTSPFDPRGSLRPPATCPKSSAMRHDRRCGARQPPLLVGHPRRARGRQTSSPGPGDSWSRPCPPPWRMILQVLRRACLPEGRARRIRATNLALPSGQAASGKISPSRTPRHGRGAPQHPRCHQPDDYDAICHWISASPRSGTLGWRPTGAAVDSSADLGIGQLSLIELEDASPDQCPAEDHRTNHEPEVVLRLWKLDQAHEAYECHGKCCTHHQQIADRLHQDLVSRAPNVFAWSVSAAASFSGSRSMLDGEDACMPSLPDKAPRGDDHEYDVGQKKTQSKQLPTSCPHELVHLGPSLGRFDSLGLKGIQDSRQDDKGRITVLMGLTISSRHANTTSFFLSRECRCGARRLQGLVGPFF